MKLKEFIKTAKNTSHFFSNKDQNPYHLEDDVWTHTKMVVQKAKEVDPNNKVLNLSALLHDIGKPLARTEMPSKRKVHFHGHEGLSFYLSLDILNQLNVDKEACISVSKLVSLHGILYTFKNDFLAVSDMQDFANRFFFSTKKEDYYNLLKLIYADMSGRIVASSVREENKKLLKKIETLLVQNFELPQLEKENKPTAYILIGVQNSGKSTFIKNHKNNANILSRDNIVMKLCPETMSYNECFQFLTKNNLQGKVNELLNKELNTYKKQDKDLIIDMTNLTMKGRRRFINQLNKRFSISAVVFFTSFDEIFKRNKERTGKTIKEDIIIDFMKRFSYPILSKEKITNVLDVF